MPLPPAARALLDGNNFAVIDVTNVTYSNEPLPELRSVRPDPRGK